MTCRVLIIGGYGNFGQIIARRLAREADLQLIIAGRSEAKAQAFAQAVGAEAAVLDITQNLDEHLQRLKPYIVIHASGPFQGQDYAVAEACIRHKCHYIDLADGRTFVDEIGQLQVSAEAAGVLVVSGASSVPCLTSAIIDHHLPQFSDLQEVDYAISTAQRTNPGVATTAAILGYAGKSFATKIAGEGTTVYGWQGLTRHRYPELGMRLLGHCDVPDLALFPTRYPSLKTIHFRAGLEVPLLHLGLWSLSWLVRWRILPSLAPFAAFFHKAARWFDGLGSDRSGFHMQLKGQGRDGLPHTITTYLITASSHGPHIPCVPAILLTQRLARGQLAQTGAMPCLGLITLDDYLAELKQLDIKWLVQ